MLAPDLRGFQATIVNAGPKKTSSRVFPDGLDNLCARQFLPCVDLTVGIKPFDCQDLMCQLYLLVEKLVNIGGAWGIGFFGVGNGSDYPLPMSPAGGNGALSLLRLQ
jgi:hypothetical protein